jgi:hypothetical protein
MRASHLITDAELREATAIHTMDPSRPDAAGYQLWGNQTAQSQGDPENMDPHIVEVALPADDHMALLHFIERIARIKKDLPPDVVELRKNLWG